MFGVEYPPFRPRKMMSSGHVQTLGAFLMPGCQADYEANRHVVSLHDGDRLVIHDDQPENWKPGDRIAILIHGLCGHHRSPYVVRAAEKLGHRGVRTFRVDLRGFGASTLISKSHLHGGCYQDAVSVIGHVHALSPHSKISLIGFSIGGNIVLKTLGFWGRDVPDHVDSAVAVSPPVDLIHCSWNLRRGANRLYESYFVKRLKSQLVYRRRQVEGLVDNNLYPLPSRLIHWDDQFTAPCWGYRGVREYYEDCSSGPVLGRIDVPTIILTSQDDPVVPFEMFDDFTFSDSLKLVSTQHGGHLGFLGRESSDADQYWMDWRICDWVMSRSPAGKNGSNAGLENSLPSSVRPPKSRSSNDVAVLSSD